MLKRFSIGKKLALISITMSAVLVGLVAYMLAQLHDTMMEDRKVKLRSLVELALNEVNRYSQMAADGKMSLDDAKKAATSAVANLNFDGKNYYFVVEKGGNLVWHPTRKEDIGKNMLAPDQSSRKNYELFIGASKANPHLQGFSQIIGRRPGSKVNDTPKLILSAEDKNWGWVVSTGIYVDDVEALFFQRAMLFMGLALGGLLLGLGLSFGLGRSITRPLNRTVSALEELCEGRNETVVEIDQSRTEIGRLTQAFTQFREKMKETEALRKQQAVAEQKAQEERRAALLGFADEFEKSVASAVESLADGSRQGLPRVRGNVPERAEFSERHAAGQRRGQRRRRERPDRRVRGTGTELLDRGDRAPGSRRPGRRREDADAVGRHAGPDFRPGRKRGENRLGGRAHQRHRRPDEPARAQRDDRGRSRRRGRQGLRGGRRRGQGFGEPDHQGDRRYPPADRGSWRPRPAVRSTVFRRSPP